MATIPQYESPDRQLTANDKGASAFEQAGRRTGPAYNEAATLTRQAAAATNEGIKMRRWAFDMLNLQKSIEAPHGLNPVGGNGGFNFSVQGGTGGGKGGILDDSGKSKDRTPREHDGGATGKVAAGLSQVAAAMARGNQYRSQTIDTASGLDINDPKLKPARYSKMLQGGSLVTYDRVTGQTSKAKPGPNAGAEKEAASAGSMTPEQWKSEDNKAQRGEFYRKYGYDPATGFMNNRDNPFGGENGRGDPTGGRSTGVQPGAGGDFNRDPNIPMRPMPLQSNGDPYSSTEQSGYDAMQRTMAPGAAGEVANTVSDMQDTFGGGSDEPDTGGSGSSTSVDYGGMDFGGGGDEP